MKRSKEVAIALLVVGLLASSAAWARGGAGPGPVHGGGMMHGGGGGTFQGGGGTFHGGGGSFHGGDSSHSGTFHDGHSHHHHHGSSVVIVGGAWGWGWPYYYGYPYYGYPYYWYPPAAYDGSVNYVEQGYSGDGSMTPSQPPPTTFWYYCSNPRGYYPAIKECPSGWQMVPSTPHP